MHSIGKKEKVVCVGLGKTGTTSFSHAIMELGYRHCGHGARLPKLQLPGMKNIGRDLALMYYDSFDDFPWPYHYRHIARRYPDCRFVLTRRRNSDVWLSSLKKAYARKGPTTEKYRNYGYFSVFQNPEHHRRLYESHLDAVRRYFSGSPRLLEVCWEEGDGWAELCGFLGVDVPSSDFPVSNQASKIDYDIAKSEADSKLNLILARRSDIK
ncbi:hypothetical protein OAV33_00435 [bacterium]|nr:hypothetical protein [bacterium]